MANGVLCSGSIVLDMLVRPVDEVRWGGTTWVDSIEPHLGGNGANTSYTVGILGTPSRLVGMVGSDQFGEYALRKLGEAGVDTRWVGRSTASTSTTVGLVKSSGERAFLHQLGSSTELLGEPLAFVPALIEGMAYYHLGSPFALPLHRPHLAETLRRARSVGLVTSLDTQWDSRGEWMKVLAPALPFVDILFMNEDEARVLTGVSDPSESARVMRELGAKCVVAKLSREGCAVFADGVEFHAPAFSVPVVDTTGAGDCFAGGYLSAMAGGASHREAAGFANAVGALAIGKLGAVEGLLPRAETERWIRDET